MQPRNLLLGFSILFAAACSGGGADGSKDDPKAKANAACGADEKAKNEGAACKACCTDNGVESYQFDGMNHTCTCG